MGSLEYGALFDDLVADIFNRHFARVVVRAEIVAREALVSIRVNIVLGKAFVDCVLDMR